MPCSRRLPNEIERAKRILVALKEAEAQGKGAASLDGKMIDAASEKMAKNVLVVAEAIEKSAKKPSKPRVGPAGQAPRQEKAFEKF